jgi:hypothetical protein
MLMVFFIFLSLFGDWMKQVMMMNIKNVARNMMYNIVHSIVLFEV